MSEDVRSGLAALTCLVRNLPVFFRSTPRTPLRVLAIMALDTLRVLRTSGPLTRQKIRHLAITLDFQACVNAEWDGKQRGQTGNDARRQQLDDAGLGRHIDEYLSRLHALETRRPGVSGDSANFGDVRRYREAVVRLSLATIVAIALELESIEAAIRAAERDANLDALFRMSMLCQVMDDVLDFREDVAVGAPSFLTACASPADALAMTVETARSYGISPEQPGAPAFPLRLALGLFGPIAMAVVRLAHRRHAMVGASPTVLAQQ